MCIILCTCAQWSPQNHHTCLVHPHKSRARTRHRVQLHYNTCDLYQSLLLKSFPGKLSRAVLCDGFLLCFYVGALDMCGGFGGSTVHTQLVNMYTCTHVHMHTPEAHITPLGHNVMRKASIKGILLHTLDTAWFIRSIFLCEIYI